MSPLVPHRAEVAPVHLALLPRWGFKPHSGLVAGCTATRLHIGAQERLLPRIPPSIQLPVEHLTVAHATLQTLLDIGLKRIELARSRRPGRIAGLIRMDQVFPHGFAITAEPLRDIGNAEPLTG